MKLLLTVYRLKIPLGRPYRLSFATVSFFDTILVKMETENKTVYSESTALYGYSWETIDTMWMNAKSWINSSNGSLKKLAGIVQDNISSNPFSATPFHAGFEKLLNAVPIPRNISVPLTGIILSDDPGAVYAETEALLKEGYNVLKIKVKGDPLRDLEKVKTAQKALAKDAKIRIDANQAYTMESIITFINGLSADGIELIEQPFNKNAWNEMKELSDIAPVPLMLDESIWAPGDIEKTAEMNCAKYVKLKLFKHGGISRTKEMIDRAKSLGLNVILGNGVQSEIGCIDEALIYQETGLSGCGELNGFLKQKVSLLKNSLRFENGFLVITGHPEIDESAITTLSEKVMEMEFNIDLSLESYHEKD